MPPLDIIILFIIMIAISRKNSVSKIRAFQNTASFRTSAVVLKFSQSYHKTDVTEDILNASRIF